MLYRSIGIIRYYPPSKEILYKAIVLIDQEIVNYYRYFVPKWFKIRKQLYDPHISFVRKEDPPNKDAWGKYEGKEVNFCYENIIWYDEKYLWLNAFSKRLEEIRLELGLDRTKYNDGLFHITLGNRKKYEN